MIFLNLYLICFGSLMIIPGNSVLYPPSFIHQPPKNAVYQNLEALMLRCVATGNPTPTYTWMKNNKKFSFSINVGRYTTWPNEGTLIFALPNDDDDGIYQCIAENERGIAFSVKSNVRRAEIQDFPNKEVSRLTKNLGESVKLPCHVPVSYPVPIVIWRKTVKGMTELLKESSKYVLDVDGNLYITGLTSDDDQALFTCTAFNERMRIRKDGDRNLLTVLTMQANYPVQMMFRTLQPIKGRVGGKLVLRCILSGHPPPTYTWSVKGQKKNLLERPNFSTDAGGAILIIDPVTTADQDNYQCIGDNPASLKPIVIDFSVEIEMIPQLTMKLTDVNVPYNGSHQFKCDAIGIPPPMITWTVNGKSMDTYLNGNNKRQIGNTIILTNLQPTDRAVFQCNASNSIGYDYSNGYINVLQDKPEFIFGPQEKIVKAENMPVKINCEAFSAPKAIVTWMKDGFAINGGRYLLQDNGDLIINKLITADSGKYTCTATNLYGSVSGSSMLYVRQRTELMIKPVNTWVYFGQEVKFVCTAKTDRLETQNLKIVWYKDNNIIDIGYNMRTNINLQDNSLIISGAETTDTGSYACNATNGLDFDIAYANLIVQSKPFTPINIIAYCSQIMEGNQVRISWNPGADNYVPIIYYLVEYSTQFDREGWYEVERVISTTKGTGESVEVKVTLRPNIEYQFRVRAINRVGMSEPSDPTTNKCSLPPTIPGSNPKELFLYGTTKDNLVIQWTPMTYVEHYGPKLGYEISVQCLNCESIPNLKVNTSYISDWDQNIITYTFFQIGVNIYQMESFKRFKASIRAKNENGVSKQPDTVAEGYSGDAPPSVTSEQLKMSVGIPTKGNVPLTWIVLTELEVNKSVNGFFRGYRIEWCLADLSEDDCNTGTQYQDVILQAQKLPVLLGNKRRKRSILEDSVDEEDVEKELSRHDTKYKNVIPNNPETPKNFQFLIRRRRAILKKPQEWNYGENITVQLTMVPGDANIKIWLRVLNSIYASSRSDPPLLVKTFEDTPGPVINFHVQTMGINHVELKWEMPIEKNGIITGYRLAWREINGLELGYMTTYPDLTNPNQLKFQMSGLKSQTKYRILIWALTKEGSGIESFLDVETQPAHIAPNAPTFSITSVVNNTVNVSFAPSDTGIRGSVFYAQFRKVGQYRWDESEPQYIRMWISIFNLANDTDYEIRIVATNGAGMATPSIIGRFHTQGRLDPTRPVNSNAIWIVMVIIILILVILLFVLMLWCRERTMEKLMGKPANESTLFHQPKIYDSVKEPLFPPSQLSSSVLSDRIDTRPQIYSPNNDDSIIGSNRSQTSGALIDNDEDLPPVSYKNPHTRKYKAKKPLIPQDSEEENSEAII